MISSLQATDAAGFANLSKSAAQASRTFRDAAASTGQFEVQQLRLNSATDDYIKKLRAQKVSFREMMRQRKVATAAYKEQLALENMQVRRNPASSTSNKGVYDVIIPKEVSADVDTARKRLAFFNAELKSGAHQMVNWGKNTQWAGRQLMVGFTMPIAAFGAAAGVMAYQLDKELTRIQKVIDTTATTTMGIEKELAQVRVDGLKTATEAAREYGSAATDTLQVQAELAATGKTGAELQQSTAEVMRIARLGEVDNNTAIEATIALQSIWRMSNDELTDSFNYMNSIENATSLSTADFAEAIPVAASSVKAFGGDVKELGILLTAMKENGIGASEGANALKATMQRLGRPSKQIREEWAALTGTDITKLVDDSDGLVEVFTAINNATKGLDEDSRRKAFAGLFGSYQVSKMMALTKGMGELEMGIGQVSTAYEVSSQSSESWAQTAATEVERYQKSISGMWDIAFQSMKIELAEVGEPFVVLGTQIVKVIAGILKAFNDLPQGVKVMSALAIGATALAGGFIMLAGLFANLAGNAIKLGAGLAGLLLKTNLLDRQTKASEMVTKMATTAATQRLNATQMLTSQIEAQTAAQREANMVMQQAAGIMGTSAGAPSPILSRGAQNKMTDQNRANYEQSLKDRYLTQGPSGQLYNSLDPSGSGMQASNARLSEQIRADMQEDAIHMNDAYNRSVGTSLELENERNAEAAKRNKMAQRAGAFMAIESAALATTLISSNKLVDDFAQVVMFAGLMGPALAFVGPAVATMATKMKDGAINAKTAAIAAKTNAVATAKAAKGAGAMGKGFTLAKGAMLALMGPLGWTVTAIAAIGLTVYKFYNDAQKKQQEMIDGQERLANTAENWGDALGLARREVEKINMVELAGEGKDVASAYQKDVAYFNDSESGKQEVKDFKALDDPAREAAAVAMLIDVQQQFNVTAERARTMVAAMWAEGTGDSAAQSLAIIGEYASNLGNLESMWGNLKVSQEDQLDPERFASFWNSDTDATEKAIDYAKAQGELIGNTFATAWNAANTQDEYSTAVNEFTGMAAAQWDAEFKKLSETASVAGTFRELGITSGKELAIGWQNSGVKNQIMDGLWENEENDMNDAAARAMEYEKALVKSAAAALGLGEEVDTIAELQRNAVIGAQTMNREQQIALVNAQRAAITYAALTGGSVDAAEATALVGVNAMLVANGLEPAADYAQATAMWTAYINGDLQGAAGGASALAGGLSRAKGQAQGLSALLSQIGDKAARAEAIRGVVEDAQNELADGYTDQLESVQSAETDANNEYWDGQMAAQDDRFDKQSDALSAQHDAEQKGMEAAWDAKRKGLENYWDARIEGVEKAIEAEEKAEERRQKMFDAEISRINKLADMANTKIDFNVALNEGNLDEAAKIANTAMASDAQSVFEREREKGAEKSANRVDRLGDKKEGLEESKDAAMEAFSKREEAAKAHMQKMQEIEQKSLDKRQEANRKRLEADADADKKALQKTHERQKENLDRILKTFLASTPTTKAALQKQVKELGKALDDFGITVLDPMSVKWGNWFKNRMRDGLNNSALESMTNAAWAQFGEKTKQDMLDAWGFKSEKEFFNFINGKPQVGMKGAGDSPVDATPQEAADQARSDKTGPQTGKKKGGKGGGRRVMRHGGGPISGGMDSRSGVAKNYHGLHPSEVQLTARRGEYVINEDAAKKFRPQLDAINAGRPIGTGGKFGAAGRIGATMIGSIAKGLMAAGKANLEKARAAQAAALGGSGGFSSAGYVPGQGGWQRPAPPGFGWRNTHDYGTPEGQPIYAISDGYISDSKATVSGGSAGNGGTTPNGVPYRSYGETIAMRAADGSNFRYAHLSARYVGAGQKVSGGDLIGRTGNTGNSSGPHLHMDVNGNYNASGYLASRGLGLRKGAQYVKFDNTAANLHRGESVLTKRLTDKMHEGVDRFANGDDNDYNVTVNIIGYSGDADELARKVEQRLARKTARRPQSRKVGNR